MTSVGTRTARFCAVPRVRVYDGRLPPAQACPYDADDRARPMDEVVTHERLRASACLHNAHGHIAVAYAQITGELTSPGRDARVLREILDAIDWIRRAVESLDRMAAPTRTKHQPEEPA